MTEPLATRGDAAGPRLDSSADVAAAGTPCWLRADLAEFVDPTRVLTRPIDLVRFASDASFYRLIPKAVVLADGVEEIRALFAYARKKRIPLTFRAAGTSLSGQAQTDGILVEVARHWRGVAVEDGGARVRVRPGTIAARVNRSLRPYGAKIGPDPASLPACTLVASSRTTPAACAAASSRTPTTRCAR